MTTLGDANSLHKPRSDRTRFAVFISTNLDVRNFVYSGFLSFLSEYGEVLVLTPLGEGIDWPPDSTNLSFRRLCPAPHSRARRLLEMVFYKADTQWHSTLAMRSRIERPQTFRARVLHASSRMISVPFANECGVTLLRWLLQKQASMTTQCREYQRILRDFAPSLVFCCSQRAIEAGPLNLAARRLGVPSVTFVVSWDHLTSKARTPFGFDHYLVWGEQMREEVLHFYPEVKPENVHLCGSPQFDNYFREDLLWSREEFFRRIGADPSGKLLLFSGGDTRTCPDDPQHVRILCEALRKGMLPADLQILVRPSPADDGRRYHGVCTDYPELILSVPEWLRPEGQGWGAIMPTRGDVRLLANVVRHSDLNVNVASTMTLDFCTVDKPVVNIAFDIHNPPSLGCPIWDKYYHYEHYLPVVETGAAAIARSPEQMIEFVNLYLRAPQTDSENRKRLVEIELGATLGRSARLIAHKLNEIALS